ncbi:MAG: alpha/beta fold hydrolase [Bacteroidia bacterium]
MKWRPFHIDLPQARLALLEAGEGSNVLLCLHGYEQRKELFLPLFEQIPTGWQIVLLDLPLYGQTQWYDYQQTMTADFLADFWAAFAERYAGSRLHLFGFSMGGKVALSLQSSVRRGALSVSLMAPDGIRSNFWHRVISSPLGLRLNDWLDRHPQWVLTPSTCLRKLRLLDPLSYRVVKLSYETEAGRERKSRQLRLYAPLNVDFAALKAQKQTRWLLIWGKSDKILDASLAQDFLKILPQTQLHILDGGHMLIQEKRQKLTIILHAVLAELATIDLES